MEARVLLNLGDRYRRYGASRPCPIAATWRADSFRATEGQPMTGRRAHALNAVLDRCDLPIFAGERLVGLGFFLQMGEDGAVAANRLQADAEFVQGLGGRDFGSGKDHHAPDYATLVRVGFGGLKQRIQEARDRAGRTDAERDFLESMLVAVDGAARHMRRWSSALSAAAGDGARGTAPELMERATRMEHLATRTPRSFLDALQLVYSYHCMMQMDDRHAMAFGRLDQYLYPFFDHDLKAGILQEAEATDLLTEFFEKITVTEDVQNITIGGVEPETGADATNRLSFLILEACRRVGRPGGNVTARIHRGTPLEFLVKCAEVIRSGIGYPAVFNDDVEIPALEAQGYPLQTARDYVFVGCIEVFIPGAMAPWSDSRFNLLHCVNLALFNGEDSLTGKPAGLATPDAEGFEGFYAAWGVQMRELLRRHIEVCSAHKQRAKDRARDLTSPLMSLLTADCIERGRDLNDGGARYPANHGVAGMGVGVTADSLAAIRKFVYTERQLTLDALRTLLRADFAGFERERQHLMRDAPKYGNDDEAVDALAARVCGDFGEECLRYRTPTGGRYWALMAANVSNISAGMEVGATADGRLARQPLSDAASPTFGRDRRGPTAVIRSVSKLPYRCCPGGNVINMKINSSVLEGEEGLRSLAYLVRTCFDLGGIQLQFNAVDREVLEAAMARPHDYENLVTRVSGFSATFVFLDKTVQQDILMRTEHRQLA